MSILDAVHAVIEKKPVNFKEAIEAELIARIQGRLEIAREAVAESMYADPEDEDDLEDEDEDDFDDFDEGDLEEAVANLESGEELTELSKKTLASYVKKSADDTAVNSRFAGWRDARYGAGDGDKNLRKAAKRLKGIAKATDKLAK